ncbi:MAG: thiamine-phosphate kinase [Candidatus Heimdallarchaeota archaeon]|nr:thiamine-phosphate kinase [Candidatus Heimdallarchaeota archaeon]
MGKENKNTGTSTYVIMRFIKDLGEVEIIRLLQSYITSYSEMGSNEDAYLIKKPIPYILLNIDTMTKTSDFLPDQTWEQIGEKLVTMTFSDLVAKGAQPDSFLSSLVLEEDFLIEELKDLASSMQKTAERYGASYLGGDLGSAAETVLTGVGIGSIKKGKILTRRGARVGDIACVTQNFGLTALGFDNLLIKSKNKYPDIPSPLLKKAKKCIYQPNLRLTEGLLLSEYQLASSAIDSSDGLASALNWLAIESNLNITIDYLPLHPELINYLSSLDNIMNATLYGGEEFEIIFTVPPRKLAKTQELFKKNGCKCIVIGSCREGMGVNYVYSDKTLKIPLHGWDSLGKEYR